MKSDREKVRTILIETIVALCNKGLKYNVEMSVEGLIGITLDKRDIFLINIKEVINTATGRKSGYGPTRGAPKRGASQQARRVANHKKRKIGASNIPNYLAVARDGGMSSSNIPQINELNLEREKIEGLTGLSAVEAAQAEAEAEDDMDLPSEGEESDLRDIMMLAMKRQTKKGQGDGQNAAEQAGQPVAEAGEGYSGEADMEAVDDKANITLPAAEQMEAPSEMVEFVNEIVAAGYHHRRGKKKKRGHYNVYSPDQRARIGQYAQEHGIMPAVRKFRNEFDRPLQDSSVRSMRKAYLEARKHLPDEDLELTELPTKDRGRPLMLGEYDSEVVEYVEALRRNDVQINHQIVMDAARGVLLHHDKNKLKEFGGPISITRKWAESFIRRIKKWNYDEDDGKQGKREDDDDVAATTTTVVTADDLQAQASQAAAMALQHHQESQHQQLAQVHHSHIAEAVSSGATTIQIQNENGTIFTVPAPAGLTAVSNAYQQQGVETIQSQLVGAQTINLQQQQPTQAGQQQQQQNLTLGTVQHITSLQPHMIATQQQITQLAQQAGQTQQVQVSNPNQIQN